MHAEIIQPEAPPVRVEMTHQEAKALLESLRQRPDLHVRDGEPLRCLLYCLAEVLP